MGGKLDGMAREELDGTNAALREIRKAYGARGLIIAVGSHGEQPGCPNGYTSVTVVVGEETETGEAVHLKDAIDLAFGRCQRKIEAKDGERKKRGKSPAFTAVFDGGAS